MNHEPCAPMTMESRWLVSLLDRIYDRRRRCEVGMALVEKLHELVPDLKRYPDQDWTPETLTMTRNGYKLDIIGRCGGDGYIWIAAKTNPLNMNTEFLCGADTPVPLEVAKAAAIAWVDAHMDGRVRGKSEPSPAPPETNTSTVPVSDDAATRVLLAVRDELIRESSEIVGEPVKRARLIIDAALKPKAA